MTAFVVQGHIQYERESHVMFQTKNILGAGGSDRIISLCCTL